MAFLQEVDTSRTTPYTTQGNASIAVACSSNSSSTMDRTQTKTARRRRYPSEAPQRGGSFLCCSRGSQSTSSSPSPLTMQRHAVATCAPQKRSALPNTARTRRISMSVSVRLQLSTALILLVFGGMLQSVQLVDAQASEVPSISPSKAPTTLSPTSVPTTFSPTALSSLTPVSPAPTQGPTVQPTNLPTISPSESPTVSEHPTVSAAPSTSPSLSKQPSAVPSVSLVPTAHPSAEPSISTSPTHFPTRSPTRVPTAVPSSFPSSIPTLAEPIFSKERFRQEFLVPLPEFFNPRQVVLIQDLFESYTDDFAPDAIRVASTCTVLEQNIVRPAAVSARVPSQRLRRSLQGGEPIFLNELDYTCEYLSSVTDVNRFPERFLLYMNNNLVNVTADLQDLGLNVTQTFTAFLIQVQTASPTISPGPTIAPSAGPSSSNVPTVAPSEAPSLFPTQAEPTIAPTRLEITFAPSMAPVTRTPTTMPTQGDDGGPDVIVISVAVVAAGMAVLGALAFYYFQRKRRRQEELVAARPHKERTDQPGTWNAVVGIGTPEDNDDDSDAVVAVISPSESLVTSKSLLSAGSGMEDDSGDEADNTKNLQDEFDQYKDQNLEQLRSDVEGNLSGFEGIMSAAVTRALMDGDVPRADDSDLLWGGDGPQTGAEIEASALCNVSDWLKRNESSSVERKRIFMQEMLNKMVTSVRFGVIEANEASLTIHESAALLGLQLANDLPMTTVIISGMRKTVSASHIVKALREFGEIDTSAVASGQRGFGIVRFRNPKSANLAMRRYRSAEIVVQDVAVQMKVLMPSGTVEGRVSTRRS